VKLAKTMSDMPWKTPTNCEVPYAIQDKRTKRSGKEGKEVDSAEEAPDENKSDGPPASASEERET